MSQPSGASPHLRGRIVLLQTAALCWVQSEERVTWLGGQGQSVVGLVPLSSGSLQQDRHHPCVCAAVQGLRVKLQYPTVLGSGLKDFGSQSFTCACISVFFFILSWLLVKIVSVTLTEKGPGMPTEEHAVSFVESS